MNVLLTSWHYYIQQLPMTLKEFQIKEGLSYQKLAEFLGIAVASTVYRWIKGTRIPGKANMNLIKKKTKGKVKPADFYG
jgi:transcriptional regulator with XRE-family HTH domain